MRNVFVNVSQGTLSGENPLELNPEDTQVAWIFKAPDSPDSPDSNIQGFRVKFVSFLPTDNRFPTTRVSPFTTDIIFSGTPASLDSDPPNGLYIYVVLDEKGTLMKWADEVFRVGTTSTFHGHFGTVVPPTGPPNTRTTTQQL